MEKATAVNTCLGVLKGRDCIYLDQVKQDDVYKRQNKQFVAKWIATSIACHNMLRIK